MTAPQLLTLITNILQSEDLAAPDKLRAVRSLVEISVADPGEVDTNFYHATQAMAGAAPAAFNEARGRGGLGR